VARGWRRLHNEELHYLYTSPDIIGLINSRRIRWAGHVALSVEMRHAYKILVGKPEGKIPLGRFRRRWENIRMNLRQIGWEVVEWILLAQDRNQGRALVNTVMNLQVP
jgi:hypothetical protein